MLTTDYMHPGTRRARRPQRAWRVGALVLCGALSAFRQAPDPPAALASLLDADRTHGTRGARVPFLQLAPDLLAPDVVLQSATLVVGRAAVLARLAQGRLGTGAVASWHPVRGGVSADGTTGFTYGYMTIARGDSTFPAKYLAFWVRGPAGWRIQAYKVGGRPGGGERPSREYPAVLPGDGWTSASVDSLAAVRTLADAERAFARAGSSGLGAAFAAFGDSLAGHLGQSVEFLYGRDEIAADVQAAAGDRRLTWGPEIVHVARSGDLGVSAGYIRVVGDTASPPRPFFTVWRRATPGAPWRYIAE